MRIVPFNRPKFAQAFLADLFCRVVVRIDRGASLPATSTASTSQPGNDVHLTVLGGTTLTASGSTLPLITSSTMATMKNTKANKVGSVNPDGKVKWYISDEGDDNTSIADEKSNDNSGNSTTAVSESIKVFPFRPNLHWRPGSPGTILENIVAAVYESHPILPTLLEVPGLVLDDNKVLTSTCEQLVIKVSHSTLSALLIDGHLPHTQSNPYPLPLPLTLIRLNPNSILLFRPLHDLSLFLT